VSGAREATAEGPVVFDRAAGYYDATRGFPPGAETRVAALLAEAGGLGPASRVLELGVGTGRIALPLAPLVAEVVGVDLSREMLGRLAGKRGSLRVHAVRADAARLPFADARVTPPGRAAAGFDAAIGVHFFHLVPRWREAMGELARLLRPGARLLVGWDDGEGLGGWREFRKRLAAEPGLEHPGVGHGQIPTFPAELGWRPVGEAQRVTFPRSIRPREVVEIFEKRLWSITWRMSDAQLARAAAELRAGLLERFGDLERPVELDSAFAVRAWLPPA
jgi:SAM-dependent methyltransferase